jgi:two-component system OmpR family sensor kinase
MARSRKLSLRARMLVLLVGVTTMFLLVMGLVSTVVLANKVAAEQQGFDNALKAAVHRSPLKLRADSGGYEAVIVPLRTLQVVQLSGNNRLTGQLNEAVRRLLESPQFIPIVRLVRRGDWVQADSQLAKSKLMPLKPGPFPTDPNFFGAARLVPGYASMLFVAAPGPDPNQVRGFIIAELITGGALIALLAIGGEWLIGRGLEPIDQMASTANEITARGDLTARMPDADEQTEVGRLGSAINTMLDRIQHAFGSRLRSEQKVREFAADASHELRTPLTTIRGYAELYRQGALGPEQLPNAMRRIEQEAQRMSTLVAELLELARLDRKSSLDLTETDLASIVRDAVADAVAVEPDRPVTAEAPPRLVAVVDEPRIRQVLANLLGNVRAHTSVSTPCAVRLGEIQGGILIEVADAGGGMSEADAARAFDRFHRAAERLDIAESGEVPAENRYEHVNGSSAAGGSSVPGGSQAVNGSSAHNGSQVQQGQERSGRPHGSAHNAAAGQQENAAVNGSRTGVRDRPDLERSGGSGLGLSIVQAIANAHGGKATLESWPGHGTKVRVWLPARTVP